MDTTETYKDKLEGLLSKAIETFNDEPTPEAGDTVPTDDAIAAELAQVSSEALRELTYRVEDIDKSYQMVAEKMGQLYMCARASQLGALTHRLDQSMRNAADNEQMFAAVLADLRTRAKQRP
jgi:small-conductance mechanosensitive channel